MPLSNKFQCLETEQSTRVDSDQKQIPHLACIKNNLSTIRKKFVKISRKKKISKLECAAKGANGTRIVCNQIPKTVTFRIGMQYTEHSYTNHIQFNPAPVATKDIHRMSAEYFYHNPHRQSPFDSLLWTKCGFIQKKNYTEEPFSYFVGKIKINHTKTGVEKRRYEAAQYAFRFLLLSGDIETNPRPRTKRKSVETKNRQNKVKLLHESEDEKVNRLQKASSCKKEAIENESSEEKRIRLECEKLRIQSIRKKETNEQKLIRLNSSAKHMVEKRSLETPTKKIKRLESVSKQMAKSRSQETPETRSLRLESDSQQKVKVRLQETPEKRSLRLKSVSKQMAKSRSDETPEKRSLRLKSVSKQMAKSRSQETPEKRSLRLQSDSQQKAKVRSQETPQKRSLRLKSVSKQMAKSRSEETPEKRSLRLRSVSKQIAKSRSEETPEKRSLRLRSVSKQMAKSRSEETPEKRSLRLKSVSKQMANVRANRSSITKSSDDIVMEFLSKIRTAADYVCCCCNRMMYASGVVSFNTEKYEKISPKLMEKICQYRIKSYDKKEWVCITCHRNLKSGSMPQQAKCNSLSLCKIPEELKDLNPLEMRLISRRIPFMKLVSLPRGRQQGIQGPAVNVPTDLDVVCDQFPRLPNQCHLISLKLKRKLEYRKSYMHDFVYPDRVIKGLQWLKEHNPLYHDICINNNWALQSKQSDPNLWNAMTNENMNDDISDLDTTGGNSCTSNEVNEQDDTSGELEQYINEKYTVALQRLQQRAKEKGFQIFDVPRDGDCLFSATCHELKKHDLFYGNNNDLRGDLAQYMRCNPVCDSDGSQYKDSLPARFESDNPLNDDTGRPDNRDKAIEKIANEEERKRQRWQLYLERLEHTKEWGDPLAIKGLAERFQVNIHVSSSETSYISVHEPYSGSSTNIHLGLILQYHYVALDKCIDSHSNENKINRRNTMSDNRRNQINRNHDLNTQDELFEVQDRDALEKSAELCGLPYETGLFSKDPDWTNKTLACAPGEKHKPIPLLNDRFFEEMSFPDKFADGKNGLLAERDKNIQTKRYFNQRLLDIDGRFARSTEYLLSAQYATECKQVHGNISHYIFRRAKARRADGQRFKALDVKNMKSLSEMIKTDQAYKLFKNVRGSPAYFQNLYYDILAMMSQLGTPTWFFTLSTADIQWPDLIQTIARQYGKELNDEDINNLTYQEKCNWLRMNLVTAVRHFEYRLETFFKHVILSNANPLGNIKDYVIRIEFQARGSPHAHTLLWVKDAPQVGINSDLEVCDFIEKYVSCGIPCENDGIQEKILKIQKHSHSSYCRKKGTCRFNFPKPPSDRMIIAKPPESENALQITTEAREIMGKVYKAVMDKDTPQILSTEDILRESGIRTANYYKALGVAVRGRKIILKRRPAECYINPYNITCFKAWQACMDIQYIEDPHACIMYIASYISKDEKGMGELLKQVSKECREVDIQSNLRKLGSVFLNNREVSAQEAAMRILSMPMKRLSRTVVFINTDSPSNRTAILKPLKDLEGLEDDDEDIFQKNIISRYSMRPSKLDEMSLASFAANYVSNYEKREDESDSAPNILDNDSEIQDDGELPKKITLMDGCGTMHRRRKEAVIRFRKFNPEKELEDYCRSRLMLFMPWRMEERDLLKDYPNYSSHYNAVKDELLEQESKFSRNLELTYRALDQMEKQGPPQHAWDNVAPEIVHQEMIDEAEGIVIERPMANADLEANEMMILGSQAQENMGLLSRFDLEVNKSQMTSSRYREMMRGLNKKQRQIVMYNRRWCTNAIQTWKENKHIPPYRIFLSGPGGVGKSHVIKLIQHDMRRLLTLSKQLRPTDVTALVTAPTGVAAFNVDGMTIHSALLLRTTGSQVNGTPLTFEKLNTLRSRLENLTLLIIDEISMVGTDMLLNIHRRLNEIKGLCGNDIWFGNVCILAVGDLFQLPPVRQNFIYKSVKDPMARMQGSGSIFMDEFVLHELTEIMRQKDNLLFANVLGRIRTGDWNDEDIATLKSREICKDNPLYPSKALHVFAFNKDVNEHNETKLNELATEDEQIVLKATDDKYDTTGAVDLSKLPSSKSRTETGGLETTLKLAVGARVMMTVNVNVEDGLVNGVTGTVKAFIKNHNGIISTILVEFDNIRVGEKAIKSSKYKTKYPKAVPVDRHKGMYQKQGKIGAQISRMQFPLTLAWAVTIHKCQGLTLTQIVVDMKNGKKFNKGQAYVAFSRVKSIDGLYLLNFDSSAIKTDNAVTDIMKQLREKVLPVIQAPAYLNVTHTTKITIGHLNVHYFLEKQKDLMSDFNTFHHAEIMCFNETYLRNNDKIDNYLQKFNYSCYRKDMTNSSGQKHHGVMVCVSSRLCSYEVPLSGITDIEHCAISVTTNSMDMTVCAIYISPSLNMATIIHEMTLLINSFKQTHPVMLIGDFNIDLKKDTQTQFSTCLKQHGFQQYVRDPTTDYGSILDHVYYRGHGIPLIDVLDTYFSDHDTVFCTIGIGDK